MRYIFVLLTEVVYGAGNENDRERSETWRAFGTFDDNTRKYVYAQVLPGDASNLRARILEIEQHIPMKNDSEVEKKKWYLDRPSGNVVKDPADHKLIKVMFPEDDAKPGEGVPDRALARIVRMSPPIDPKLP